MSSPHPFRSLIQNVLLSVVSVVVTLGLVEGVARLLEPEDDAPEVASYITDWAQWDGDFYTVKGDALGWPPFEDYNQDGVRDRAHTLEKPEGVRRLVCLGDSTTAGYKIRADEAWPQVLQDLVDASGLGIEVFNVALGGWSTRQELIAYRRIARKYQPDQVLVGICLNDIPELGNNLSRPSPWLTSLYRRSALVRRVVDATAREIRSIEELFEEPDSVRVQAAYERLFDDLMTLRDEVEADGATFGIVVFPFRLQIAPDAPTPLPQEALRAFSALEGIPFLDLLPALQAAGEGAFVDYDHFSPFGSQVVAEQVLASGLIAAPGSDDAPSPQFVPGEGQSLVDQLNDDAAEVRASAAWAMGRLGPAADVALLEERLRDDDPGVRAGAAWSLGRVGARASVSAPALVVTLSDDDPDVRRRAVAALERIRPAAPQVLEPLRQILTDPDASGRAEAARVVAVLGAAGAEAVPDLLALLESDETVARQEAVRALGAVGAGAARAVPALVKALEDPALTWRAADALGSMGPSAADAVAALTERLGDERPNVQWRSAVALGKIGDRASSAGPELARLVRESQANVRLAAVTALARIGADPALRETTFVAALSDDNPEVRSKATNGLRRLGRQGSGAVPALAKALEDPDAWVRVGAARALGRVGSPEGESRAALERALEDADPMVRDHAARALRTLAASQ